MTQQLMKDFVFLFTPWWGKSIGLLLGYLTAGPAGAVFGVLIGNLFDIGLYNVLHTPQWHYYRQAPSEVRNIYMPTLFKVMGHIAKIDGRVTKQDIEIARRIMREIRLFGTEKQRAMHYYNEGKSSHFKLENQLRLIKQLCYQNPDLLLLFAETQYRAARTKQPISDARKDALNMIFITLGFKPAFPERFNKANYYQQNQQQYSQHNQQRQQNSSYRHSPNRSYTPPNDYAILGIQKGERAAVVKKAYRKIMSQIHPDKLIARGASQLEIDAATERAQQVQKAYERIKKERGF